MRLVPIIIILCVAVNMAIGQTSQEDFRIYSKKDGLSGNNVTSFAQTPDGYLWLGTTDGLNRYDGYSFKVFKHHENDTSSISDNYITALYVDHTGALWIGTKTKGLNRYRPADETFEHFLHNNYNPTSITDPFITCITEDANNQLWIGTSMGLNLYNKKTNTFKRYFHETEVLIDNSSIQKLKEEDTPVSIISKLKPIKNIIFPNVSQFSLALEKQLGTAPTKKYTETILKHVKTKMHGDHIQTLEPDRDGNIWVGYMNRGLYHFNPHSNFLEKIDSKEGDKINNINSLLIDGSQLWIGETNGNLKLMDLQTNKITHATFEQAPGSIEALYKEQDGTLWAGTDIGIFSTRNNDTFLHKKFKNTASAYYTGKCIYQDNEKNIWIALDQRGVKIIPYQKTAPITTHFKTQDSLSLESISSVMQDHQQNLWIGYYSGGISLWNSQKQEITYFEPQKGSGLGKGSVYTIFEDNKHNIWIGTYDGGLQKYQAEEKSFVKIPIEDSLDKEDRLDIRDIKQDHKGNLWMASHGHGLIKYNPNTEEVKVIKANYLKWEHSLANDWLYTLAIDAKNQIWIGSVAGVTLYNTQKQSFKTFNDKNSNISHNQVRSLFIDDKQRVWVGTEDGLNLTDTAFSGTFKTYSSSAGLTEPNITAITEDPFGTIWTATKNGIYTYDKLSDRFVSVRNNDNFDHNELFHGSYTIGDDGKIHFGGNQGLITINPSPEISDTPKIPLFFTQMINFNEADSSKMLLSPKQSGSIKIPYNRNNFVLHYVGINLSNPAQTQYSYKLEGKEKQWTQGGKDLKVIYHDLPPGKYTFMLKATNKNGLWRQEPVTLTIVVSRPFWMAWSTYLIVLIIIAGSGFYLKKKKIKTVAPHYAFTPDFNFPFVYTKNLQFIDYLKSDKEAFSQIRFQLLNYISPFNTSLKTKTLPLILILDNENFAAYEKKLSHDFDIEKAYSEKEAFLIAMNNQPDIIISKTINDKMDGIRLCHKIKSDPRTAFIPVILTTHKISEEEMLQSMSAGAEDYLPYSSKMLFLKTKLTNLIRLKRNITEHTLFTYGSQESQEDYNNIHSTDFLSSVQKIIHEHISDDSFGPNHLASKLNMSRSQLYKKVKKEFGQSVSILIRNMRLQKALDLLKSSQMNIAEIAYKVGFTDPGYFTRCFKNYYGKSPSEYLQAEQK
ncbi:helix-turn-helix domain-containing protein [Fulvivirga maritima]|uniref:two-component regulator propeller domain-containing protein n=1 Tax=Fulvivirga maritima TaxID=2904247 RepID=UPI001F273DE0|nr:two-component regulator propeller domain-containing protein [Fulvivirga maritima]UII27503.1 helix-turn-helix domain-containing protein [Fulvivirga maritima]